VSRSREGAPTGPIRRTVDWWFRDRDTGRIVVAQVPNLPLAIFLAGFVVDHAVHPAGTMGTAVHAIELLALAWWAGDEILRGVNPWRRAIGAVALVAIGLRLVAG
jgi:hypothetical protein